MKNIILFTIVSFLVLKLSAQTYNPEWFQTIVSNDYDRIYQKNIVIDNANNIYCTGYTYAAAYTDGQPIVYNGAKSSFLIKYDSNGNYIWSRSFDCAGDDYPRDITIDGNNNIYVTGRFTGSACFDGVNWENSCSCGSAYIIKFDENGNYIWHSITGVYVGEGTNLDIDENNNIYITTISGASGVSFENQSLTPGSSSSILAKYDSQNNFEWMFQIRGLYAPKFTYENNGIYLVGHTLDNVNVYFNNDSIIPDTSNQIILFKFDISGNLIWHNEVKGRCSSHSINSNNNNIFLSGSTKDTLFFTPNDSITPNGYYNGFIISYDSSYNINWKHCAQSEYTGIYLIDFDSQNKIWITCGFRKYYSLGSINISTGLNDNALIHTINEDGTIDTNDYFQPFYGGFLRLDNDDNLILSSGYTGFLGPPYNLQSYDMGDILIRKLSLLTSSEQMKYPYLKIYPNPASDILKIESIDKIKSYSIYSTNGKLVKEKNINTKNPNIDIRHLVNGLYFIKLNSARHTYSKKFTKQ